MERLRIGIVGGGFMGGLHARAVAESGTGMVAAIADPDTARASALAAETGGGTVYPSHDAMFAAERLDGVVVATPEPLHRPAVEAAAAAGVPVMVEKPIAHTLEDADAMIAACERAGVPLLVAYILRHEPAYARINQAVRAGTIGRPLSFYARRNAPIGEGRRLAGRTTVINYLAVHDLDQILWSHSAPVTRVTAKAVRGRIFDELGVADFTWIMAEFADGALAVVESGWGLSNGWASWTQPSEWGGFGDAELNVIGTDGLLSLDLTPMNLYGVDATEGWKLPDTRHWPVVNGRLGGAVRTESDHFLRVVAGVESPISTGRDARRSLEIGIAADRSIEEDAPVTLPL
jgi:UDP-N-acetylglucosamine 3-dehydrogenase